MISFLPRSTVIVIFVATGTHDIIQRGNVLKHHFSERYSHLTQWLLMMCKFQMINKTLGTKVNVKYT